MQASDIDDHHIADLLPAQYDHKAPEAVPGTDFQRQVIPGQDSVEDQLPDIAQDDAADEVGHEKRGAEDVGAGDVLGQHHGHREGNDVDEHHRHHGECGGEEERVEKLRVLKRLDKVGKTHELGVRHCAEVTQRQIQPHDEGDDEADDKGQERGGQEYGEIALDGFFHGLRSLLDLRV